MNCLWAGAGGDGCRRSCGSGPRETGEYADDLAATGPAAKDASPLRLAAARLARACPGVLGSSGSAMQARPVRWSRASSVNHLRTIVGCVARVGDDPPAWFLAAHRCKRPRGSRWAGTARADCCSGNRTGSF